MVCEELNSTRIWIPPAKNNWCNSDRQLDYMLIAQVNLVHSSVEWYSILTDGCNINILTVSQALNTAWLKMKYTSLKSKNKFHFKIPNEFKMYNFWIILKETLPLVLDFSHNQDKKRLLHYIRNSQYIQPVTPLCPEVDVTDGVSPLSHQLSKPKWWYRISDHLFHCEHGLSDQKFSSYSLSLRYYVYQIFQIKIYSTNIHSQTTDIHHLFLPCKICIYSAA
jgi:hypothetical protein